MPENLVARVAAAIGALVSQKGVLFVTQENGTSCGTSSMVEQWLAKSKGRVRLPGSAYASVV